MGRRVKVIPEGVEADRWPKVRMWYWIDDSGDVHLTLEHPAKGQHATQVAVPAPQDPELLLALIGRATGAGKELTALEDMQAVKRELHRLASEAKDEEQAAKRRRAEDQWATGGFAPQRPSLESGRSIRAISAGAPGFGKRR